jgi:predicted amidophosphoribosyltransferase
MDKAERKQNLKDAFQVVKPIIFEHIAIIDDVVTTGSTVHAMSQVLKEAGVDQIDIWCICRA